MGGRRRRRARQAGESGRGRIMVVRNAGHRMVVVLLVAAAAAVAAVAVGAVASPGSHSAMAGEEAECRAAVDCEQHRQREEDAPRRHDSHSLTPPRQRPAARMRSRQEARSCTRCAGGGAVVRLNEVRDLVKGIILGYAGGYEAPRAAAAAAGHVTKVCKFLSSSSAQARSSCPASLVSSCW